MALILLVLYLESLSITGRAQENPALPPAGADRTALMEQANQQYLKENYQAARDLYLDLSRGGNLSPVLFFNLGNAEFRLGNPGAASLWYRRALELNPRMTEAAQNLRLIRQKQGFQTFRGDQFDGLASLMTLHQWRIVLIVSMWAVIIAMVALLTFHTRMTRTICWPLVILGSITFLVSGAAVVIYHTYVDPRNLAVVVEPDAAALTGPFPDAKNIINLPEGTEVRIHYERDKWLFVETPASTAGWVHRQAVEPVRNW